LNALPPDPQSPAAPTGDRDRQFDRARTGLQKVLARYQRSRGGGAALAQILQPDMEKLAETVDKLDRFVVRIAAFGLVSRGKSAVLNGLLGEALLETGPLNGVTRVPRSVQWRPDSSDRDRALEIELIDTPGLDEIDGHLRADLAKEVAQQADLILFIVAGDINRTEERALAELRRAHKPLILVFNKIDLIPEGDRPAIVQRLRALMALEAAVKSEETADDDATWQPVLPVDEVVSVAAQPAPLQVREEWPDGRVTYGWESPPPEVGSLRAAILKIVDREGRSLLALNALLQARLTERAIAQKTIHHLRDDADLLIWRCIRLKAAIIAISPLLSVDAIAAIALDGWLVKGLADLYGLPATGYRLSKPVLSAASSIGLLLLSEIISWGIGGLDPAALSGGGDFSRYLGAGILQGLMAALGSRLVGKASQTYLESGCTWGMDGSDTLAREILARLEPDTILHRLREDLQNRLDAPLSPSAPVDASPQKTGDA
jgi:small GTP-binding protein